MAFVLYLKIGESPSPMKGVTPTHSRDSSLLDVDAASKLAAPSVNKVRFALSEEESSSTNPSDSNNSTSTDSGQS